MAIGAAEYTELVASTLEKIEPTLVDQVLTTHPTLDLFVKNAKSDTGRKMVYNLEGDEDDSTVITDASGTFSTSVSNDVIGASEWDWSNPIVSKIRVKWLDLQKNAGKEQLVDMLKAHVEAAKKGHAKKVVQLLHNVGNVATDGTATWTGTAGNVAVRGMATGQFESFDRIVSDAAYDADPAGDASIPAFTVGGIDPATADYWQASRLEVPLDHATMGTGNIRKAFRHARNELLVANSSMHDITHMICGRTIFEELEDSFDDAVRYVDFGKGQTRFRGIYDGDIEVRLDPDCQPDRAYFIDINAWRFRYLNGNWMKTMPAQAITGTLDFVTPLASVLAVGTNERRAAAVLLRPSTAGGDA